MNPTDAGPPLREAARYISRWRGRVVVVKAGGAVVDGTSLTERLLPQIKVLCDCGVHPVLVHGGGRMVDAACLERGVAVRSVGGRRPTPPPVLSILLEVLADGLNGRLVAHLRESGVSAAGYADGLHQAVRCTLRPPSDNGDGEVLDWGRVGDVQEVDANLLAPAGEPWRVPVLPSVGVLADGSKVNVNADEVAARVAVALGAAKLIMLAPVPGVMADPNDAGPVSRLRPAEARALIADGTAAQGMQAKLEAALHALAGGVTRVHIISGLAENTLLREMFTSEGCGTLIREEE